jgi:response regulator RpfG family c-di-GMP phosphodiesterase
VESAGYAVKPRILCVDDEPRVLEGMTPHLRRRFDVSTAPNGDEGLEVVRTRGPFAVVMSDMRMPGMNGAQLLAAVRSHAPDTVRLLLTGQSDLESAVAAVNEGQIFRFLTKPCPMDRLLEALTAAVEQHRLICAERVLLAETLQGSIRTLIDILSLDNPLAFGRAGRVRQHVSALAAKLQVKERWPIETAAMLAPIGSVTLPPETVEKVYHGHALTEAEEALVSKVPAVTERFLANIPRLEPVREILKRERDRFDGPPPGPPLGARLIRMVSDYDLLETQGESPGSALAQLRARTGLYDPALLDTFGELLGASEEGRPASQAVTLGRLRPGMVFAEDVRSRDGALLIARGHEVTESLIERMRNFSRNVGVREPLKVADPKR